MAINHIKMANIKIPVMISKHLLPSTDLTFKILIIRSCLHGALVSEAELKPGMTDKRSV